MSERGFDRIMDRLVLPGYSAIGYRLRRAGWSDDDPAPGSLVGKRALVTGAGGGLGEETVLGLARLGAHVHLLVRSAERAEPALARLRSALAGEPTAGVLEVVECDVSDLEGVRRFADRFVAELTSAGQVLDLLVHNAGVMPAKRTLSPDGFELSLATHVLGPVLMTELLMPALRNASEGSRVVLVASGGMYTQRLPVDDPNFSTGDYSGAVAYARSKRVQVELTPLLAERWQGDDVAVHVMHPGWADTPGVASSMPTFRKLTRPVLRDSAAGADTIVWLCATRPAPRSGLFWHDRAARPTTFWTQKATDPGEVSQMWEWTREAIGLS